MKLEDFRRQLDKIDENLLNILSSRFEVVKGIAEYKYLNQLNIKDQKRENEILDQKKKYGEKLGLDTKFVENIFELILEESRKIQNEIIKEKNEK